MATLLFLAGALGTIVWSRSMSGDIARGLGAVAVAAGALAIARALGAA